MKRLLFVSALLALISSGARAQDVVRDTLGTGSAVNTAPSQLLRGRVAGLRVSGTDGSVTGALNTVIRGLSSVHAGSEPLWVIDGVFLTSSIGQNRNAFWQASYSEQSYTTPLNTFFDINPYDIESIEVLKDMSATALYGSRGANGVILIKTKLPQTDGLSIQWNSNLGINFSSPSFASVSHNHAVSFTSRQNRNAFGLSAFFRSDGGSMKRSGDMVGGVRLNYDSQVNKTFWFGVGASITKGRQDAQNSTGWYGHPTATYYIRHGWDYSGYLSDYDDYSNDVRSVDNVYVRVNFLPNLYLRADAGIDYDNNTRYIWYGNATDFGLNENGAAALLSSSMLSYRAKSSLNYSVFLGGGFRMEVEAGAEYAGNVDKFNNMNGHNFFTHEMRAKGLSINGGKADIRFFSRAMDNLGLYGTLGWNWKDAAGVQLMLRGDRTFRYEDRFVAYPSASAWFDFAKALLSPEGAVSSLKLKGGWGKAGYMTFSPYEMFSTFVTGMNLDCVVEGTEILYEGYNKVVSSEWNLGVELSLWKDVFSMGIAYYEKTSDDLFHVYCFGKPKGIWGRWFRDERYGIAEDAATIRNRGIELTLDLTPVKTKDWTWTLSANTAFPSSQITKVSDAAAYGPAVGSGVVEGFNAAGWPVGSIFGYETDANGACIDHTGDGRIGEEDKEMLGRTSPLNFGGLYSALSWKNLSFVLQTDYAIGHKILNMNKMLDDGAAAVLDKYVEKGDYFRLSRLSLSYAIPLHASWLKNISVSLTGANLLALSPYSGYSPDVDSYSLSPYCRGVDYCSAPLARTVMLGVGLKF